MSEIRINSIKIKNYRSFGEEQNFIFPNKHYKKPTAIVGYNNSGKTNLMNCLLYGIGNKFIQTNTFEKHDLHNLKYNNDINIKIELQGSEFEQKYIDKQGNEQIMNKSISGLFEIFTKLDDTELKSGMTPSMFGMNKHYNIFYINFHNIKEEISTKKTSWGNLTSFLAKHIKKIVDSDASMASKQQVYEQEVKEATEKVLLNSTLSSFVSKIKENYTTNLRDNNCEVSFGLPDYEDIFLQMVFKVGLHGDKDNLIPIEHFGDGYISMFVMAVIQSIAETNIDDKCLFLFEEPESFLHENHQEYFYKMVLCNLSERGHQVVYTTHSDRMVDIFDTKGIIRIEFDENTQQTVNKYNNVGNFNPTLPTDDNGQKIITLENFNSFIKSVEPNLNKILFSRKVLLVEGPNDIIAYRSSIENEVERIKGNRKFAETYLSFLNIAILVHHGKATAHILIDLAKHFGLDYFAINDWDFDTNFITTLSKFRSEKDLKQDDLYLKEGLGVRSSNSKGMVTTNWKLINSAGLANIHFNIPKIERVLGYPSDDKNSLAILNIVMGNTILSETFFPKKLRNYLELNNLTNPVGNITEPTVLQEIIDELPF